MLGLDRIEVKKVFISQPMRRKSEAEIKAVREEIVKFLGKKFGTQGFTVIDSYHPEWAEELKAGSDKRVFFLGKSIQMLADADYAFLADGWSEFDGCLIEHDVCRLYKIPNNIYRIREDSARNSAEIDGESAASETPCGGASAANTASDGSTRSEEPIYKILRSYNINHELELFKLAVDITNSTTDYLTDYLCGDKPWEDRNKLEANIMAAYSLLRETWERIKQERGI